MRHTIEVPTTYDTVRYIGSVFGQTHPNRLATLATMFGMHPAPVDSCRVLEIGCGDGGNLIPMGAELPGSHFVGIDLAETAVEAGKSVVRELGLSNVDLRTMNILDVKRDLGEFDYIIAHGVYSWIPRFVQDKLLAIAAENLAPQGVAYISYNAFPGAHLRLIVRDMMLYHLGDPKAHANPIEQALPFLKFVETVCAPHDDRRAAVAKEIADTIERAPWAVYHDELAEAYTPVYFHEFIERAKACGLQFLSEAQFQDINPGRFTPETSETVEQFCADDRVRREQIWDFLRCRKFRATLLVHDWIQVDPDAALSRIPDLYVSSRAEIIPADPADGRPVTEFKGPFGASLRTEHAVVKTVLVRLVESWPESVPFPTLLHDIRERTGAQVAATEIAAIVLSALYAGLLYVEARPASCVKTPGERPVASPIARWQAQSGTMLTTLRHTSIDAEGDLERYLVTLLDGTRDREALFAEVAEAVETDAPREVFEQMLRDNLEKLGRMALLMA